MDNEWTSAILIRIKVNWRSIILISLNFIVLKPNFMCFTLFQLTSANWNNVKHIKLMTSQICEGKRCTRLYNSVMVQYTLSHYQWWLWSFMSVMFKEYYPLNQFYCWYSAIVLHFPLHLVKTRDFLQNNKLDTHKWV